MKDLVSINQSICILKSLWVIKNNIWIPEYPPEIELHILNKLVRELQSNYKNLRQYATSAYSLNCLRTATLTSETADEVFLLLTALNKRIKELKKEKQVQSNWFTETLIKVANNIGRAVTSMLNIYL